MQLWQKTSIDSVNIIWNKSQQEAEEKRHQTKDPATLKKINKWIQDLRIATIRWVQDISNVFAALVKLIGTNGTRMVPPFNESPYKQNGTAQWPGPQPLPGPGPGPGQNPIPLPINAKIPIKTDSGEVKTMELKINSRMIDRNPDVRIVLKLFGNMKKYKCPAPHNMATTSWTLSYRKPGNFVPAYQNHRTVFFAYYQYLKKYEGTIEVHHAIEQRVKTDYPGLFLNDEITYAIENLRGICGDEAKSELHRRVIYFMWSAFYSYHKYFDIPATREDCIWYCREIDYLIGDEYYPYYNPSLNRPLLAPLPFEIKTVPR